MTSALLIGLLSLLRFKRQVYVLLLLLCRSELGHFCLHLQRNYKTEFFCVKHMEL